MQRHSLGFIFITFILIRMGQLPLGSILIKPLCVDLVDRRFINLPIVNIIDSIWCRAFNISARNGIIFDDVGLAPRLFRVPFTGLAHQWESPRSRAKLDNFVRIGSSVSREPISPHPDTTFCLNHNQAYHCGWDSRLEGDLRCLSLMSVHICEEVRRGNRRSPHISN